MGHEPEREIGAHEADAWLKAGGLVVAASERAARALTAAYNRARRAEGLTAWPAANILDWPSFVRRAWIERGSDSRMTLSGFQEQALWAEIVGAEGQGSALLEGPRHRLAALAMDAHRLLCAYAPRFLSKAARSPWQQDPAAFGNWLSAFDRVCESQGLLSEARLPQELLDVLAQDSTPRPALLLAGFDRILPMQRRVFEAWGEWRETARAEAAGQTRFYAAADAAAELAACARWCKLQLEASPRARLLVITQDVAARRGEIERAFLRLAGNNTRESLFEFSLGVPLRQVALARGAELLLRWLSGAIEEHEIDWLFSTGQLAANDAEARALVAFMRALRDRGMERTRWRLEEFMARRPGAAALPLVWTERMTRAKRQLDEARRALSNPLSWIELVPRLLETVGWPGTRSLTSGEFQALRRWQQALDACATLGFNGRRIGWTDFLSVLFRALDETLFAPESRDAPIQIAGPAESAGLTAHAIWMMGASEDKWPSEGAANPLLPFDVQREASMPHAAPQLDWDLAQSMTARIVSSAAEVVFSCARLLDGIAVRPSRLIERVAGPPRPVPAELHAQAAQCPRPQQFENLERFEDISGIPLAVAHSPGGSTILTSQSQCPFKAFAAARLNAQGWESAQAGLTASQRGQLLHSVLHSVWAGEPEGIRTHAELVAIADLEAFVERHVRRALRQRIYIAAAEFMPRRYLELEALRLARLVKEWLDFERTRAEFSVARTEFDAGATVAGLDLKLRIDRIDRLNDGSLLVIDYKTGSVSPSEWDLPRPNDVQVPLYAAFALSEDLREAIAKQANEAHADSDTAGRIGGLVFATVRTNEACFQGRVGNAQKTLLPNLSGRNSLLQNPLNGEDMIAWRVYIETMALDFIAGRAAVDPRDYPKTCERCDLQSLCRIRENRSAAEDEENSDD